MTRGFLQILGALILTAALYGTATSHGAAEMLIVALSGLGVIAIAGQRT